MQTDAGTTGATGATATAGDHRPIEPGPGPSAGTPADEAAIRDRFHQLLEAWGRGDGDA
jgi:hypothetical protein